MSVWIFRTYSDSGLQRLPRESSRKCAVSEQGKGGWFQMLSRVHCVPWGNPFPSLGFFFLINTGSLGKSDLQSPSWLWQAVIVLCTFLCSSVFPSAPWKVIRTSQDAAKLSKSSVRSFSLDVCWGHTGQKISGVCLWVISSTPCSCGVLPTTAASTKNLLLLNL